MPPPVKNADEIPLDDSDSDSGPAPPPTTVARPRVLGPSLPPTTTSPKRTIGPSLPPADLSTRPTEPADSDSDSDSDYGPALPGATPGPVAPSQTHHSSTPSEPIAQQRDSWMLAPPTSSRGPDPTKLKARKFASGPRTNTNTSTGMDRTWTETASEKAARLRDEVLGRSSGPSEPSGADSATASARERAADERNQRIRAAVEAGRGASLYESHQAARAEGKATGTGPSGKQGMEEEDDPSKRGFDWEKDMKGGTVSGTQRRQMLNKAADFGGRFSKGSFL